MRHLTKTNKHFLLVGLTFLATSLIFYILAWLGQPSLENTLVNVSSIAFTLGVVTYIYSIRPEDDYRYFKDE